MSDDIALIEILESFSPGEAMDFPVTHGVFQLREIRFLRELPATLSMKKEDEAVLEIGPFKIVRSVESLSVFTGLGDILLDEFANAHLYSQLSRSEEQFMSSHMAPEDFVYVMERSEPKACPAPDYGGFGGDSEKF